MIYAEKQYLLEQEEVNFYFQKRVCVFPIVVDVYF